jgi:hypothetical protein
MVASCAVKIPGQCGSRAIVARLRSVRHRESRRTTPLCTIVSDLLLAKDLRPRNLKLARLSLCSRELKIDPGVLRMFVAVGKLPG